MSVSVMNRFKASNQSAYTQTAGVTLLSYLQFFNLPVGHLPVDICRFGPLPVGLLPVETFAGRDICRSETFTGQGWNSNARQIKHFSLGFVAVYRLKVSKRRVLVNFTLNFAQNLSSIAT